MPSTSAQIGKAVARYTPRDTGRVMSQENVEIVRRAFDAFNARDADELVSLWAEDCEWRPFRAQLEGIVYRGHEGVRQFLSDIDEDWEAFRIDTLEFHERLGRVVVIGRVSARGRGSSLEIDSIAGFVHELDRGQIRRITSHSDAEAALAVLGRPE
jgi:ketosteroid isomerase-like protein